MAKGDSQGGAPMINRFGGSPGASRFPMQNQLPIGPSANWSSDMRPAPIGPANSNGQFGNSIQQPPSFGRPPDNPQPGYDYLTGMQPPINMPQPVGGGFTGITQNNPSGYGQQPPIGPSQGFLSPNIPDMIDENGNIVRPGGPRGPLPSWTANVRF